ncbi:MAG: hypothetical protein KatS3mg115_2535 [Candidatus Poribacteria bacterium]|nr:MAG: hypothetical protein KatS3mg115_2535 [Candidatus Poribacteria bacterium]
MKRAIVVWLGAWALTVGLAAAHEPIFGVGPHVIGRYGIGLETGLENGEGLHVGLHLGLAADFGASVELERGVDAHAHGEGWGSPRLRTKWRFYRRDGRGRSDQAAIVLGYRFEEGAQPGALLLGATVGRESRVEYFFAGLRYQVEMDRGRLSDASLRSSRGGASRSDELRRTGPGRSP